jgi:hypothetical protein
LDARSRAGPPDRSFRVPAPWSSRGKAGHASSVGSHAAVALDPENQYAPLRFFSRLQGNLDGMRVLQTPDREQGGSKVLISSWERSSVNFCRCTSCDQTQRPSALPPTQLPERLADQRLLTRVESPSQCHSCNSADAWAVAHRRRRAQGGSHNGCSAPRYEPSRSCGLGKSLSHLAQDR